MTKTKRATFFSYNASLSRFVSKRRYLLSSASRTKTEAILRPPKFRSDNWAIAALAGINTRWECSGQTTKHAGRTLQESFNDWVALQAITQLCCSFELSSERLGAEVVEHCRKPRHYRWRG